MAVMLCSETAYSTGQWQEERRSTYSSQQLNANGCNAECFLTPGYAQHVVLVAVQQDHAQSNRTDIIRVCMPILKRHPNKFTQHV